MRKKCNFPLEDAVKFKQQMFQFFSHCKHLAFYDSNNYREFYPPDKGYADYDALLARGAHKVLSANENCFGQLKQLSDTAEDWLFGVLSYELKNEIEQVRSKNEDKLHFPNLLFFIPKTVFYIKENTLTVEYLTLYDNDQSIEETVKKIEQTKVRSIKPVSFTGSIRQATDKDKYLQAVSSLKQHISLGDIYEVNYCTEFFAKNAAIEPVELYRTLSRQSPTPFSAFFRIRDFYLLSASPERFLKKTGTQIISQPIKGTIKRGSNAKEDNKLSKQLLHDPKERAENLMITDLVRNDLSRTAAPNSVKVDELFGIYRFPQVFQMISTVCSQTEKETHPIDVIQAAFPPGSMTGTPKISAMLLADQYEDLRRSWYSGCVGYITPKKDFDFNVIIRSILYNAKEQYLSFSAGGAITHLSVPEKEYQECLLKAGAIFDVLTSAKTKR